MSRRTFITITTTLLAVGIAGRLIFHVPNATPLTAIAVLASMFLPRYYALVIPAVILFLTDLVIGLYTIELMVSVYLSFGIVALIGMYANRNPSIFKTGSAVIIASLIFFLITNTAVWVFSPWYEKTMSGLLYAYELGLPFYRNMLIGDLIYTPALYAVLSLIIQTDPLRLPRVGQAQRIHRVQIHTK